MGRRKRQIITDEMMTLAWEDAALAETLEDAGYFAFEGADSYAALKLSGLIGVNWFRVGPDKFRAFLFYGEGVNLLQVDLTHKHFLDLAGALARKTA